MVIDMNESPVRTVEQVRQVLQGTQALEFRVAQDDEGRYQWIATRTSLSVTPRGSTHSASSTSTRF
jgi:hypothetical protein